MSAAVEPELQPYFRIAPESNETARASDEFTFTCKTCRQGYAFKRDSEAPVVLPLSAETVLDSESRNALLAHARSHRAPRLRLI